MSLGFCRLGLEASGQYVCEVLKVSRRSGRGLSNFGSIGFQRLRGKGLGFNFFGFGVTGFGFRAGASEPSFVALLSRGLCGIPLIGKRGVWNVGLDGRS